MRNIYCNILHLQLANTIEGLLADQTGNWVLKHQDMN